MTYIFLDTNSLLHFQDFENINWNDIVKDPDYEIVICPMVLNEINKHKDSSIGKRRERAKNINKKLSDIIRKRRNCKVPLTFCKNPSRTICESDDFNSMSQDDWIVYSAVDFDTQDRKVIISNDNGLFLRCQDLGIECLDLPDKYLCPMDPTNEESEIKQLKKQIELLTNAAPILDLCFDNHSNEISFPKYEIVDIDSELEKYKESLIEEFPHRIYRSYNSYFGGSNLPLSRILGDEAIQEDDVENYNRQVDEYIDEMCAIKKVQLSCNIFDRSINRLNLLVENSGSIKSGEMRICIYFPDELMIYTKEALCEVDVTPPYEPKLETKAQKRLYERIQGGLNTLALSPYGMYQGTARSGKYENHWNHKSQLKVRNPYMITADALTHYFCETVTNREELYISTIKEGDYIIKWQIVDENQPLPFSGELIIHIH